MIFLAAGLVLIVGLSILERVRERPSSRLVPELTPDSPLSGDRSSGRRSRPIGRRQPGDRHVPATPQGGSEEGPARGEPPGERPARASRGPGQDRTESPSHAGTIAAPHQARAAGRGDGSDTGCQERRGETENSPRRRWRWSWEPPVASWPRLPNSALSVSPPQVHRKPRPPSLVESCTSTTSSTTTRRSHSRRPNESSPDSPWPTGARP